MRSILGALLLAGSAVPLSAAGGKMLTVGVMHASVRAEADPQAKVLWRAWIYTPFEVLRTRGAWTEVRDFEGDRGWVSTGALIKADAVIVSAKSANIRRGPGMNFPVDWEVERGFPFRLLDRVGNWLMVEDEGEVKGWIHRSLVWGETKISDPFGLLGRAGRLPRDLC